MKELVLVRHGESEHLVKGIVGGWSDLPLTDRGRQQISITANRLKELFASRIEIIYASDLRRASESAEIINEKLEVLLPMLRKDFEAMDDFSADEIERVLRQRTEKEGIKAGLLIHALRMLVVGDPVSPGIFEVLELVGKQRTLERMDRLPDVRRRILPL